MSKSDKIVVVNNGGASSVFWGLFLFFIVFPCVTVLGCFACTGTFLAMNVPKAKDSENQSPKSIEPRAREVAPGSSGEVRQTPEVPAARQKKEPNGSLNGPSTQPAVQVVNPKSSPVLVKDVPATSATPVPAEDLRWRNWTSSDGKFSIYARFVRLTGELIYLQKEDGSEISVKANTVSPDDFKWIIKRGWEKSGPRN